MGLIYADLLLANPSNDDLLPINATALVDTGALFLCIPAHIASQLKLKEFDKREVIPIGIGTDGSVKLCSYVGPILLKFANRQCLTGALVIGETVLLGAVAIEEMDLII